MTSIESRNWFSDEAVAQDPYPFLDALRSQCPVQHTPHHGVVAVTGYEETSEVLRDHDTFSACVTVVGPFADFPAPLDGDDVSELTNPIIFSRLTNIKSLVMDETRWSL